VHLRCCVLLCIVYVCCVTLYRLVNLFDYVVLLYAITRRVYAYSCCSFAVLHWYAMLFDYVVLLCWLVVCVYMYLYFIFICSVAIFSFVGFSFACLV